MIVIVTTDIILNITVVTKGLTCINWHVTCLLLWLPCDGICWSGLCTNHSSDEEQTKCVDGASERTEATEVVCTRSVVILVIRRYHVAVSMSALISSLSVNIRYQKTVVNSLW